ncbi:MAG TPA: efflux RND transporter permease subunit, partial [Candidatus Deferrimicrobium sp.]|nr:efflux RND transporter permease subunit [Candidatus Deferrimicrobium sp.]
MNIPDLFIRRPIMTTLVMGALLLFGTLAYQRLPVSDLPNVDFPTILVTANLPGASPETMASSVATPLERQFTTIAGLDSMVSSSGLGLTQITLTFTLDRNIDAAAQDVQASITKAASLLPKDMPTPPSYQKVNPAGSTRSVPRPVLPHPSAVHGGRVRADVHRPTNLYRERGRPGPGLRVAEVRDPHPARSRRSGLAGNRDRRGR